MDHNFDNHPDIYIYIHMLVLSVSAVFFSKKPWLPGSDVLRRHLQALCLLGVSRELGNKILDFQDEVE